MFVSAGISFITGAVAVGFLAQVWHARPNRAVILTIAVGVLLCAQHYVAREGLLKNWQQTPPPLMLLVVLMLALTTWFGLSATGRAMAERLPFAALVGLQAFRLPLELVMHRAAVDGLMPVQMSYSGYNFDILTGLSAIPVAWLALKGQASRWLLVGWNAMGSLLLVNIVSIAVASTPTFAAFGPERLNTWVTSEPYVWLPGFLVPSAFLGHFLIWRKVAER